MRYLFVVVGMLACPLTSTVAQVSIGIGLPNISIGINVPIYPQMAPVPGYPVYYATNVDSNYFFYDGMYWVYERDTWYASSWFDGPWAQVDPETVPLYVLRVPVSYYRQPPAYFGGWREDAPPRWGEHWGADWERQHGGWEQWNRQAAPSPAPLPDYQRQYSGDRYPRVEQQQALHVQNYRYQPREAAVQQVYKAQNLHNGPASSQRGNEAEQPGKGAPQQTAAQRPSAPSPQAMATPHEQPTPARNQGEQPVKGAQQTTAQRPNSPSSQAIAVPHGQPTSPGRQIEQPAKSTQQTTAQRPRPPSPQAIAAPPGQPTSARSQGEQPAKGTQQTAAQRPNQRAMAAPQGQSQGAQDRNEGQKGKAPEPKGNSGQAKGDDRSQEHR